MQKYAVVREGAVARFIEAADDEALLPIVSETDDIGENQVLGPIETVIEADRVVYRRRAQRALSGLVAVPTEDGHEIRDLGERLVPVADNVLPVEDVRPPLGKGKVYGAPANRVENGRLVRTFPVIAAPIAPVPTLEEKLASIGLNLDELREALKG